MKRMGSGWIIAIVVVAASALAAGCAAIAPAGDRLADRVGAVLERRGLGGDALRVIDNLLQNGPAAPLATPALVRDLLARPLEALDAQTVFARVVPPPLVSFTQGEPKPFAELLNTYVEDLARAQHVLQGAVRAFDEDLVLRQLQEKLPLPDALLPVAEAVEREKLHSANQLFIDATARFARHLAAASIPEGQVLETGFGRIVIGTRGNDVHRLTPVRGGKVAVIIDPGGDDEYRGSDLALSGFSAIIDLGGNDRYTMDGPGLGAAIAGAALLVDFAGDDRYEARFFAQGAGAFGFGALLDLAGNDRYRLEAWGQGFAIADGTGLLWDRGGDDSYLAGGVADPFHRAGGLSGAQGAAFGYRGRIAGGIGILRDDGGDDTYGAQMFAQGNGYYYALGLLWDRGGNDNYRALQYAQGNGVHQAIGVLREESGNDSYDLATVYGQGMGLDIAFGALVDDAGDDAYSAYNISQGAATANGLGLLADGGGADRFATGPVAHTWGHAEWMRGLPTVAMLLHGPRARFTRDGRTGAPQDWLAVQPMSATACPSSDPGESLLCRLRDAPDPAALWTEYRRILEDRKTPLAGWIAIALGQRPPSPAQAEEIAALLAERESCNVRALALRSWPTLPAAQAAVHSPCYRLQAAGVAALAKLGAPLPADARLPSFLRRIAPQDDTF